jgi:hypothetical protein
VTPCPTLGVGPTPTTKIALDGKTVGIKVALEVGVRLMDIDGVGVKLMVKEGVPE